MKKFEKMKKFLKEKHGCEITTDPVFFWAR